MRIVLAAGIAIFLGIFPRCVHAVCPVPEISPSGEYFKSDIVIIGTVMSVRYKEDADRDTGGWFYRLRIGRVFRGNVQGEVTVFTEDASARLPLENDGTYLLFAQRHNRRLEIDSCGNSSLLSDAAESVRSLEAIPNAAPFGVIEGQVAPESDGVELSGVPVTVRGHSESFTAVTGNDGRFHFRVPAGHYKLDFSSHEYYLNSLDFAWYNPNHFVVHPGETVSVQVFSVRHATRSLLRPSVSPNQIRASR